MSNPYTGWKTEALKFELDVLKGQLVAAEIERSSTRLAYLAATRKADGLAWQAGQILEELSPDEKESLLGEIRSSARSAAVLKF